MPYNPGITYRGGELIAAGIERGMGAFADGWERMQERQEKKKEEDKRRSRETDAYATLAETSGLASKDQLNTMSLDQLKGMVEGTKLKQFLAKGQQDMDLSGLQMDQTRQGMDFAAQRQPLDLRALENKTDLDEALAPMTAQQQQMKLEQMAEEMNQRGAGMDFQALAAERRPKDLSELMGVGAATGYRIPPADLEHLTSALADGVDLGPMQFDEDPESGARFARRGKVVLPSGYGQGKAAGISEDVHDGEGNVVGTTVRDARGRLQIVHKKKEAGPRDQVAASKQISALIKELNDPNLTAAESGEKLDQINALRASAKLGRPEAGGSASKTKAKAGTRENPIPWTSDRDYSSLPSGSFYIAADGTKRQKK